MAKRGAKKLPAVLHKYKWKKGQAGTPAGTIRKTPEQRALETLTRQTVADLLNRYLQLTPGEIKERLREPETPMFEAAVGAIVLRCRDTGNFSELDRLLDRCIGKVPQKIESEITGGKGSPLIPPTIQIMPVLPMGQPIQEELPSSEPVAVLPSGAT